MTQIGVGMMLTMRQVNDPYVSSKGKPQASRGAQGHLALPLPFGNAIRAEARGHLQHKDVSWASD